MSRHQTHPKVAIAGAGIAGAYLYRLLRQQGHKIDLFDIKQPSKCGLTPCAWGTSNGFIELVKDAGLNPGAYILRRVDHVMMDEVKIKADLMTINKPALIEDLLGDQEVRYSRLVVERYDRVIDATGVSRAYLPKIGNDIVLSCKQYRVETDEAFENRIKLGGIGYSWCFPLADYGYHLGCGSFVTNPRSIMEKLDWLGTHGSLNGSQITCGCEGKVRLTGPHYSLPFVTNGAAAEGIWGVGEAIGCVAPLAGDGIVPGMRCVQILLRHWHDPNGYAKAVLRKFHWMKKERDVVDKLIHNERLGIGDARILKQNSKRMGMKIGLKQAGLLMERLR